MKFQNIEKFKIFNDSLKEFSKKNFHSSSLSGQIELILLFQMYTILSVEKMLLAIARIHRLSNTNERKHHAFAIVDLSIRWNSFLVSRVEAPAPPPFFSPCSRTWRQIFCYRAVAQQKNQRLSCEHV